MGVELTPAEIDAYLLASPRVILCVARKNKAPLPMPMWFGWIERKIVMTTLQASRKVGPIRSNPQVACLVESGEEYFSLKALLMMGTCEVVDDQEQVTSWQERIFDNKPMYKSLFPAQLPPHLERFYSRPRSALIVTPTTVTTWDFANIPR